MCRAEALSPPHLSVLSSHHCSVHPCLLSVELATRKSLYVLHHAAPCEQLPLLHSQITLIHVSHPSPCTIGIPHSPGSLCWERVHLPQLLTSWKLLLRCPECSVRSPFASPPHPVLCARAPSPPTARARPGPCAAWRGAAPSLLPAAHAALCSGPVAPHAWLFPHCSSPPCAHALAVPCCRWSRFLLHSSADGCCSSLPAVSLAHACRCAPVRAGAHALLPPILLACAPTGSGLTVSSCSRSLAPPGACQCHAQLTGVGTRSWGEEGLLRGLRLFAVDVTIRLGLSLAHSFWAQACSLSLWGSPVLIPGSCSLAVVLGLTLTRLLLCWCTHMAHIEVFTPFGCGSSSSS